MIKKKILLILFVTAMITMFSSCNKDMFSVKLITDQVGEGDDSFNQPAIEGLYIAEETIEKMEYSIENAADIDDYKNIFANLNPRTDLVVCLGYNASSEIITAASENSNIDFIAIDCEFHDVTENLTGIQFKVEESSFLAGYIAGMTTETNKIAFVGGKNASPIWPFEYGYKAGVDYAAEQLDKQIDVSVIYLDSFTDYNLGKEYSLKLYEEGNDIIFQAAGSAGTGVIEAAKETNKFVIGVDIDQSYLAPDNVLTSVLKDIKSSVIEAVYESSKGKGYPDSTIYFGLKEGGVDIAAINPLVDSDVISRTYELKDLIINGIIDPPANEKEYKDYMIK